MEEVTRNIARAVGIVKEADRCTRYTATRDPSVTPGDQLEHLQHPMSYTPHNTWSPWDTEVIASKKHDHVYIWNDKVSPRQRASSHHHSGNTGNLLFLTRTTPLSHI